MDVQSLRTSTLSVVFPRANNHKMPQGSNTVVLIGELYSCSQLWSIGGVYGVGGQLVVYLQKAGRVSGGVADTLRGPLQGTGQAPLR